MQTQTSSESFKVIRYDRQYLAAFVAMNREWIEKYFKVEEMDLYQLNNPEETILKPGGEIFFVVEAGRAVGTCAMVRHGESYELAKMAVAPEARGKGYGDVLMETAITWAREKGLKEITILSNTVLEPAITLYHKHGFETMHLGSHPDYKRCNIEMRMTL